jgi:glycosyltransferase involved in cell wall biosynthesis
MRIGLISYEYPPQQGMGGVGTYMFRLAGALGRAGHEVHVITGPSDRPPVQQQNVSLHRIPAEFEMEDANRVARWFYWHAIAEPMGKCNPTIWHWMRWNLASYEAIRRIDAAHPFDVVEAPEHAANGWMAGRIHRWPIVIRVHCPWELFVRINRAPFNPMDRLMSMLERRTVANYADCLTVPSEAMRRELEKSWKLRRPPKVIPNFMDVPGAPALLPGDEGPARIICAGRIEPLKGQDTLARAFAIVAKRNPRAELWFLGPDRWGKTAFAELLPKIVPDAGIRARIHMPGLVPLAQIGEHLRNARLAVIASIGFESFSYSTLEAMAAARPTIVTRTGALPELIEHERSGLVVSPNEPHEMAAALERYLGDRSLSDACRLAAFARAKKHYDTGVVLPQMMESYQSAADFFYGDREVPSPLKPGLGHFALRAGPPALASVA